MYSRTRARISALLESRGAACSVTRTVGAATAVVAIGFAIRVEVLQEDITRAQIDRTKIPAYKFLASLSADPLNGQRFVMGDISTVIVRVEPIDPAANEPLCYHIWGNA